MEAIALNTRVKVNGADDLLGTVTGVATWNDALSGDLIRGYVVHLDEGGWMSGARSDRCYISGIIVSPENVEAFYGTVRAGWGEFTIVEMDHDADCAGCIDQAHGAAVTAATTGSVGAKQSQGGVGPSHGARVVRTRELSREEVYGVDA